MKPLPKAPLTKEDDWCWYIVMCRKNGHLFGLRSFSVVSDRRDADLMLRAQYQRQWLPASGSVPALPPWLLPVEWNCGPVGGDIVGYV